MHREGGETILWLFRKWCFIENRRGKERRARESEVVRGEPEWGGKIAVGALLTSCTVSFCVDDYQEEVAKDFHG